MTMTMAMESLLASPSSSASPTAAALGSRGIGIGIGIGSCFTYGVRQKKEEEMMTPRRDMGVTCSSLNSPSSSASTFYTSRSLYKTRRCWWRLEGTMAAPEFIAAASAAATDGIDDDEDVGSDKSGPGDRRQQQRGSAKDGLEEQFLDKAGESKRDERDGLDEKIPGSPEELIQRVSSVKYDIRRQMKQTVDSIAYDVLESNPWREHSKPVYVLTHKENQLCTMKTRRSHSEVERELGLLFSKQKGTGMKSTLEKNKTKFQMFVEDIREGILVFEDENDAERYCDLLQGGKGCEGIAEIEASSVFDICRKMKALAVLFRRGRVPPSPETLELNLKFRNRSLEDE